MSKRKGLSIEEKRKRILEIFDSHEFYTLKEIEKIGSQRGVVSNTIKDIVECLVADNLVQSEKVGTSHYFFRFPQIADLPTKKVELEQELLNLEQKNHELIELIEKEEKSRPQSDSRTHKMEELVKLQNLAAELQVKLEYVSATMDAIKQEKGVLVCKNAANRWTENVFNLESYLRNEFQMDLEPLRKEFKIPADLDTL